jgi:hypothetical protein
MFMNEKVFSRVCPAILLIAALAVLFMGTFVLVSRVIKAVINDKQSIQMNKKLKVLK